MKDRIETLRDEIGRPTRMPHCPLNKEKLTTFELDNYMLDGI